MAWGIFLAWVVTRTDTPFRRGLEVLIWLKLFLPYQPAVIAWILLASPKAGLINQFLKQVLPFDVPPINIYSYGGIIWVSVLGWSALVFLLIVPAFRV